MILAEICALYQVLSGFHAPPSSSLLASLLHRAAGPCARSVGLQRRPAHSRTTSLVINVFADENTLQQVRNCMRLVRIHEVVEMSNNAYIIQ